MDSWTRRFFDCLRRKKKENLNDSYTDGVEWNANSLICIRISPRNASLIRVNACRTTGRPSAPSWRSTAWNWLISFFLSSIPYSQRGTYVQRIDSLVSMLEHRIRLYIRQRFDLHTNIWKLIVESGFSSSFRPMLTHVLCDVFIQ